jgi:hypothetical protein
MHRSQLSLYWLEQIRRAIVCFVHLVRTFALVCAACQRLHPGSLIVELSALPPVGQPRVQPILQIKQSPEGVRQKTPAPISNFSLWSASVLVHPSRHFRVVRPGRDEFPQCSRVQSTGIKELAVHRTVVMIRSAPADEFGPAFVHQAPSHGCKVSKRSTRASRSGSVQIERKRTQSFCVHNSA